MASIKSLAVFTAILQYGTVIVTWREQHSSRVNGCMGVHRTIVTLMCSCVNFSLWKNVYAFFM